MFSVFITFFGWLRRHTPARVSALRPRFNFITIHYMYLIGWTLLGSILVYPAGGMEYIDALFFASGAATQSGLNTIDINKISLYQQLILMLIACLCNPIWINTFVVFIRLYWFEKRFQNVVQEAQNLRRTRTRSRTKSEAKAEVERDIGREENGVGDRSIVVVRGPNGLAQGRKIEEDADVFKTVSQNDKPPHEYGEIPKLEGNGHMEEPKSPTTPFHRDIMFADEVNDPPRSPRQPSPQPASNDDRVPEQRTKEQHIAFVENQRNPKDKGTLRIPGPRDFDRGFVPERIEDDDGEKPLEREMSRDGPESPTQRRARRSGSQPPVELNQDDHPIRPGITFDDAEHPGHRPGTGPSLSAFKFGSRAKTSDSETLTTGAGAAHFRQRAMSRTFASIMSKEKGEDPMPYLSWTPTVGRNSAFVDLTEDQREELGGIEYRSLKMLAIILVCYFIGFHLFGMVCLLPWITRDKRYVAVAQEDGFNPVWWGFFTPASMFNDLGFTLTPDSMISFQLATFPLLIGTFLIIIGNTGFPCMLRFVIWLCSKCVPRGSGVWEELQFLLDHPRRCFTLLFPSRANWWLFFVLVILNGIDLIFFVILDLNDETVTSLPGWFRFLDGLFQAASTRTAGFACVNLSDLHPAIQVSYLIMMYISVFPIAISMRQTNVYEEKSLGVWADHDDEEEEESSYLGHHLRRQLSFDLWFVFLGFFLIAIVEGNRLQNTNDYAFTLFSVLFEIVSAYGTVGLSLGYPGINASFSAEFKTLSKLIMIAMQLRGRHRGLPYALDRAILLPSESLHKKEDEDATRRARRGSTASQLPGAEGLSRVSTGGSRRSGNAYRRRRNSSAIADDEIDMPNLKDRGRTQSQGIGRFLSGALSAGPTIPREKRA